MVTLTVSIPQGQQSLGSCCAKDDENPQEAEEQAEDALARGPLLGEGDHDRKQGHQRCDRIHDAGE